MFEIVASTCLDCTLQAKRERESSQKAVYKTVPRTASICGVCLIAICLIIYLNIPLRKDDDK